METIKGPVASSGVGLIYQVTLASGAIATNPVDFGVETDVAIAPMLIVTEDGRVLASPVGSDVGSRSEEYNRFEELTQLLVQVPKSEIDESRTQVG